MSYPTSESFTGKYWIDGKPIYRIANKVQGTLDAGQTIMIMDVSGINYENIVNMGCTMYSRGLYWTNGDEPMRTKVYVNAQSNVYILYNIGDQDYGNCIVLGYLEYTKSS